MTIIIEISRPWQWRPGRFTSRIMRRAWWGFLAVGILRIPFAEFATTAYDWRHD